MDKATRFRRAGIAALGASLIFCAVASIAAPCAAAETAQPLPGALAQIRFKAIKVDVSPLIAKGLAPEASWMAEDLPGALRGVFAGRLAPGDSAAPTLIVRIDGVFLGSSGGGGTSPFGDSVARDNIEGAGVVVAPGGKSVASYPLFTTLLANTGGSARELGTARGRVANLADSFAYWLPGQMGL